MVNLPIEDADSSIYSVSDAVFESKEQMQRELTMMCHGNLCTIGRIWIQALRSVLVGASFSLIPIVEAKAEAKEVKYPEKPPKMKYTDLPFYESPHHEYKDYLEEQNRGPKIDHKLIQEYLLPKVRVLKKSWNASVVELKKEAIELKDDAYEGVCKKKDEFVNFMRHPDNHSLRKAVVVSSAASGYFAALASPSFLKKILFTALGALTAGSLCFPGETGEIVKDVSFKVGKAVCTLDCVGDKKLQFREVPCRDDMPQLPTK